jgi:AraC-like DNA-binding protein
MIARRETRFLPDGTYLFRDRLDVNGVVMAKVVTCKAWLLEMYALRAGDLFFMKGETAVHPGTRCFGVLYPPFSIARPCLHGAKGDLVGIAGTMALPAGVSPVPTIFDLKPPLRLAPIGGILKAGHNPRSVETNPHASSLSSKAKKLIGELRASDPSIGRIAARLGVSNAHLSRQFRRDYGMSPREYLHQLRIADAPLQLARGGAIADVSLDSGYNDLGRFYKQFGKVTKSSPGRCREIVAPSHR